MSTKVKIALARSRAAILAATTPIAAATPGQLYIAHLGAYNSGTMRGNWITPDADPEILMQQIRDAVSATEGEDFEWAVHDYSDFPNIGEDPSVDDIAEVSALLEEHPLEIVKAALEAEGNDVGAASDKLEEGYSVYDDAEDFAFNKVEDQGGIEKLPAATVKMYFDYEAYGRDLEINSPTSDLKDGKLLVWNS
jgi:antirestriction protein